VSARALCAGGATCDLKLHLAGPSVPGTSNPARARTSFGGVARNVAENLAALLAGTGVRVDLLSAVGDDAPGRALLDHLAARGVGTGHVLVLPGEVTAQYVAVLEPDGGLSIGAAAMSVLDRVDVAALDAAWPTGGWLFLDGNLSAAVLAHALQRARREGLPLAVDAVSTPKVTRLPADLTGIGVLSCNADEARAWLAHHGHAGSTGADDVAAARAIGAAGAAVVLLTRGARGLLAVNGDQVHDVPAEPADPVDVTGAGDALIAGTIHALFEGRPLAEAARTGARLAARTVESAASVLPPGALRS
jgi:pseudouridine kinase